MQSRYNQTIKQSRKMSEPESLADKQKFLSAEIIQDNLDPEEFQEFMSNHSDKPLDLNQWTFSELKQIVLEFKDRHRHQELQMSTIRRPAESSECEEPKTQINEHGVQEIDHLEYSHERSVSMPESVNSSLYKHFAFRKKQSLPELYVLVHVKKKEFHVKVAKYSKSVPNNIFKSSYIDYCIETSEKWEVRRRYTDFLWLQNNLAKTYPGLPLPPIPQKTTIRSFDEKHVQKRMMFFQKFLAALTRMPEICSDPILQIFMRADSDYFSKAKKQFEDKALENYETCTVESIWGEEQILSDCASIDPSTLNFYANVRGELQATSAQLTNLQESLRKAKEDSLGAAQCFKAVEQSIGAVRKGRVISVLQDYCQDLAESLSETMQFVRKSLANVWLYESMYVSNLVSEIKKIRRQQEQITHKSKTAMIRVSDRGSDAMVNSYEPSKGIKEFQIAKEQYKIKISYLSREIKRFEQDNFSRITNEWAVELGSFIAVINNWAIHTVDQLTRTHTIRQGKQLMEVQYKNT